MTTVGFDQPLYVVPFDHRGSFQTKMFGWNGALNLEQTAQIAAAKHVIYDGFRAAVAAGVPKAKAGILVDEQFGGAILREAAADGYTLACPAEKSGQDEFDFEYGFDTLPRHPADAVRARRRTAGPIGHRPRRSRHRRKALWS